MRKKLTAAFVCLGLATGSLWLAVAAAHVAAPSYTVVMTTTPARAADPASHGAQQSPQAVMLVINEYLADPPDGIAGDANGDGTRDPAQDEFIELVNNDTAPLNIGSFTISDATQLRFTFPAGKVIPPGEAAVIFGGGTPMGEFGNATANGLVFAVGGAGLSLNNTGDTITVKDDTATTVATRTYDSMEGNADQSITRSPDVTGGFVRHSMAPGSGGALFSPGTRVNGATFTTPLPVIASLSPNVTVAGSGDVEITVTGSNFQAASQVRVDGNVVSTTFSDTMHLSATVPTAITNLAGAHAVTVENPGSVISNSVTFTVLSAVGINEYLADPPGSAAGDLIGDANGDGTRSSSDDEFVEVVNRTSVAINLGGYKLRDADAVRFTFPAGATIPAGEAAVVFGGGTPMGEFGNAKVNGLVFTTGSGGLSLNNGGDTLSLLDPANQVIEAITYGSMEGNANQSLNRNPEIVGTIFAPHTSVAGSGGRLFSPGTLVNGAAFTLGPRLTDLMPDNAPRNAPAFDMTIHGSNFEATAKAFIDGGTVPTTFVSATELIAHVPTAVTAVGGGHNVQVFHDGGNRSNVLVLTILITDPVIDSISPDTVVAGSGDVEITVTGSNFQAASQVRVDGNVVNTTFADAMHLNAIVPTAVTNMAGLHTVAVVNPGNIVSNAATFTVLSAVGINEYLADPPGSAAGDLIGDANGDGTRSSSDDEFVEVVNRTNVAINLGGYKLRDLDAVRFTFPAGATIPAGEAAVVFGGGTPTGEFGNAKVNGLVFTAGSGGLSLNNGGDTLSLLDPANQVIEAITYGSTEGNANQSLNRNPEIVGTIFAPHTSVPGSGGRLFSPGARVDGMPFTRGPRISSISPDSVPLNAPAFDLTIHGSNFEATAEAFIDGGMTATTFVSATELIAHVPATVTAIGTDHIIQVRHEGGNRSNSAVLATILPPPQIAELLPRFVVQGSAGFTLFIRGQHFGAASKVLIEGTVVTTTFSNTTELRAAVPASFAASLGPRRVRVRNGDGKESNDLSFEIIAASARLNSLTPTGVTAGSPAFTLKVAGAGFKAGATVLFDDAPLATTFVSATEVQADVPAALVAAPGLHGVQERNADGGLSNQAVFFVMPNPPLAKAVDPSFVIEGAGDIVIIITGERFAPGAVARLVENNQLGARLDTTVVTSERLSVLVPARFTQAAGSLALQVENPDFGVSNTATLRVFIRNPLVINEYLADPPGSAAGDLIGDANGDGARSSSQDEFVEIINRTAEAIDLSGFKLSDADEVRHVFAEGTVVPPFEVVVVFGGGKPKGDFGNAAEDHLVFTASTGGLSLNNGGDTITLADAQGNVIEGIKFGPAEGGANQSINRDPDGNGAAFARHAEVAHDTSRLFSPGTQATGEPFSVKPAVQSLTPAKVHAGSAPFTLAVAGSNFAPGATVLAGDTPLATAYRSDALLEAQVGAALVAEGGSLEIRVRNPKGERSSAAAFLVFDDAPRLARLTPDQTGTGAENLELTVEGERFQRGATVIVGGQAAATEFASKTMLKAILPASLFTKPGTISARVKNADGNLSNTLTLAVDYGPLVTRLSPRRLHAGGGAVELTVGGVAFKPGVTLFVNDVAVPTTFVSDTSLTARIPAEMTGSAGKLTLQARHADGGRSNRATLRVVR
jgi:hypothetical protein